MAVVVLDPHGAAIMPCSEKRARGLLERGRARVHHPVPFVIRLTDRTTSTCVFQPRRIKRDPGSNITGIALVRETGNAGVAGLTRFELIHRGRQISEALTARRSLRRRRRGKLRDRAPRFLNRRKPAGGRAPSWQHRVDTPMAWVRRFQRWAPISAMRMASVRFDVPAMENPEISGVEYPQGTLAGFERRDYLLAKEDRKCAYCDKEHVSLDLDHIHAKAKGGSNRVSNLALSGVPCNEAKAARPIAEFLTHDPKRLARIPAQAKRPLQDAAAVNATRWALFNALKSTGRPIETGTGGRTKWNISRLGVPKTHALDAVCVGVVNTVQDGQRPTLTLKATGRGRYPRTRSNAYGFPRSHLLREKSIKGFQTGDLVVATVTIGQKIGVPTGRVAIRRTGSFNVQTAQGVVQGIDYKHCRVLQRADGYGYLTTGKAEKPLPGFLPRPARSTLEVQPDRTALPRDLLCALSASQEVPSGCKPDDRGWGIRRRL